jgi:two-component system alkaline phosphatase synthesis response regulator PhoP
MNNEQMSPKTTQFQSALPVTLGSRGPDEVFDNGLLRVEHDNYYVSLSGRTLKLPRKEFLIISRLTRNFDRIIPSEDIWRYAWGDRAPFNSESLHVHIYRLRRRLAPFGLRIVTMVNVGYRLTDVRGLQEHSK